MKKIELLAPAGNLEKAKTAFTFGADAVYLGVPDFSLRVRINDFTNAKIKQVVKMAREQNKKVYVTLNIFAHNKHVNKLEKYIKFLKEIKVDALIISDPGVMEAVRQYWKNAEIHLSTQANCTNWQAVKFWEKQGVKRVILGREVTLKEIKEIHKKCPKVELEYFVHGAMCMAYSGRCFLSKHFVNRSGNLGDCVQPCRWNYFISEEKRPGEPLELVQEEHGSYILNSKDLCLIKYLDDLKDAGIISFKIEGRAKSVYYQAVINHIYREAIDLLKIKDKKTRNKNIDRLYEELETRLVSRGYTTGFLLGEKADENTEAHQQIPEWEFCGQALDDKLRIRVHNTLKIGDRIEIVRPEMPNLSIILKAMINAKNGEEMSEAHGGGSNHEVVLDIEEKIPKYSVIRRKIK